MKISLKLVILNILITTSIATINPRDKKAKQKKKTIDQHEINIEVNQGPVPLNVYDRDLVHSTPLSNDIVRESRTYHEKTNIKNFNETVLGYVTPVS
jgi:hypothetical protein